MGYAFLAIVFIGSRYLGLEIQLCCVLNTAW